MSQRYAGSSCSAITVLHMSIQTVVTGGIPDDHCIAVTRISPRINHHKVVMTLRKIVQKSRNGEFSELGELFAYYPESAHRTYADSKKAK